VQWSFLENLPIALAFAWLWTFLAFLVGRALHRHATIDVFWGAGFLVIYMECFRIAHAGSSHLAAGASASFTNRYIVLVFVALWGFVCRSTSPVASVARKKTRATSSS